MTQTAKDHLIDARAKLRRATRAVRNLIQDEGGTRVYHYTTAMEQARDAIAVLMEAAQVEHGDA